MREVIGSYELDRVLGQGGMGVVWLAEHTLLRRRVAIKLLSSSPAVPGAVQRFLDEAQATSAIEDSGIVQIFDFGYHTDGRAYIVMEYLEGERLDARVARTPLSVVQAMRLARQLASSMHAAHARDVLHRDLKPDNILLITDPAVSGGIRAKLLDFGICKLMNRDVSRTRTGVVMGTPMYMSPEQCRDLELDARSDLYSLGCVLQFMLTGQPLFAYRSSEELLTAHVTEKPRRASVCNAQIPCDLDELLDRCLAKDPADRIASMADLATELTELIAVHGDDRGSDDVAAEPGSTRSSRSTSWARRAAVIALAAMALSAHASPPTVRADAPAPLGSLADVTHSSPSAASDVCVGPTP